MNLMSSHIAESPGTNETMYDQLREEILKFLGGDVNMTAEIMALPQDQRVTNIFTIKASYFSNCLLTVISLSFYDDIYLFKPNGISRFYQLDQPISVLRVVGCFFSFSFKF